MGLAAQYLNFKVSYVTFSVCGRITRCRCMQVVWLFIAEIYYTYWPTISYCDEYVVYKEVCVKR